MSLGQLYGQLLVIFNAKLALFQMSLLGQLDINKDKNVGVQFDREYNVKT